MNRRRPRIHREHLVGALVWACAGTWAAFALIRLFGLERGSALVPVLAFTPWIAAASVIPIALASALRRWGPLAIALVSAGILAALVVPRALGGATEAEGSAGATLRVLAANVEFGQASADDLVELARELEVDALAIAELTPQFADVLRRAGIGELLPHSRLSAEPRARGTGIYSRLALADPVIDRLPGGFALPRARVAPAGAAPVELVGVHTAPPTELDEWKLDLEALPAPDSQTPRILAGDFNATLDHAEFREVLDLGYADAAATLGNGLTPTWPNGRRVPPLVAIDHVIADERLGIREFSAHDVAGTDHRAVFAELELPTPAR